MRLEEEEEEIWPQMNEMNPDQKRRPVFFFRSTRIGLRESDWLRRARSGSARFAAESFADEDL